MRPVASRTFQHAPLMSCKVSPVRSARPNELLPSVSSGPHTTAFLCLLARVLALALRQTPHAQMWQAAPSSSPTLCAAPEMLHALLLQKEKAIEVLADIPGVQKSDIKCVVLCAPVSPCAPEKSCTLSCCVGAMQTACTDLAYDHCRKRTDLTRDQCARNMPGSVADDGMPHAFRHPPCPQAGNHSTCAAQAERGGRHPDHQRGEGGEEGRAENRQRRQVRASPPPTQPPSCLLLSYALKLITSACTSAPAGTSRLLRQYCLLVIKHALLLHASLVT